MGAWGIGHWLVVLAVVLLVFGTKRLRGAGRDLGEALRGFKKGLNDGDDTPVAELQDQARSRSSQASTQTSGQNGESTPR